MKIRKIHLLVILFLFACERNPIDFDTGEGGNNGEGQEPGAAKGTWLEMGGLESRTVFDLEIGPENNLYAATDSGIFRKNILTSQFIKYALDSLSIQTIGFFNNRSIFAASGDSLKNGQFPVFYSENSGQNWILKSYEYPITLFKNTESFGFLAGTDRDGIYQWQTPDNEFKKLGGGREIVLSVEEDVSIGRIYIGTFDSGLFYTNDLQTWQQTKLKGRIITSIYLFNTNKMIVSDWVRGIYRSDNAGEDFSLYSANNILYTYDIAISDDSKLLLGTLEFGILKENSVTSNWDYLNKNLPTGKVTEILNTSIGDIYCIVNESKVFKLQ